MQGLRAGVGGSARVDHQGHLGRGGAALGRCGLDGAERAGGSGGDREDGHEITVDDDGPGIAAERYVEVGSPDAIGLTARESGDVLRDQLFYLARCGFDAVALRADQDAAAALAPLGAKARYATIDWERNDPDVKPGPLHHKAMEIFGARVRGKTRPNLVEGINNKIKVIKRMAYGFRDDAYFFLKIRAAFPGVG